MEFNKSIKSSLSVVYNLVGSDFFLINQAIKNLKSLLIQNFEEFNFQKIDAEKLKKEELVPLLETLPIGNDYRLVVLNNPSSEAVDVINKFEFVDSSLVIVCVNAEKLNVGEKVDCAFLERNDLTKYILNYLSKNETSIKEQALDYLIEACDSDLTRINNELNKLVAYATEQKVIDMEMVTNLVTNSTEYVIYMLTSAIDEKNLTKYQSVLHEMNKNQTSGEIFSYLGKYFKRMQNISLSKDDNELSSILNIKPYAIKMSRQAISKNGIKYYINLYHKYVDLDYKIKSGKITAHNALYELVF